MRDNSSEHLEPQNALALPEREAVKTMVQKSLREQLPGDTALGITTKRLNELVRIHRLDENQLDVLLSARRDFEAGISQALALFNQGLTMEEVYLVYGAREAVTLNYGDWSGQAIPLQSMAIFVKCFKLEEVEPETLADIISTAYKSVGEDAAFLTPTNVINLLLEIAGSHEEIGLEAAVEFLQQSLPETDFDADAD